MSLSSFVDQSEIRARLRQEFRKPRIISDLPLLAEPQSKRYGLVGTAFDYLLRFFVQRRNPSAQSDRWVAEAALSRLGLLSVQRTVYDIDSDKVSFPDDDGSFDVGQMLLTRGQAACKRYLETGSITDSLLKGVIGLAQLDTFYRCGRLADDFGTAHREDTRDLRKLISLVNPDRFRVRKSCFLNPRFGDGSHLIGGADADLYIDGTLIEVKTTAKADLRREHFNQLLGYLALMEIWGTDGAKHRLPVSSLGIYFARHASLQVIDLKDIATRKQLAEFYRWFREAVEKAA